MKTIEILLVTMLVGSVSFVQAAEPSPAGKWKLVVYKDDGTPNSVKQYELELNVDGEKLTGSFTRAKSKEKDKEKEPVVDGTIKDGKVRFGQTVRLSPPHGPVDSVQYFLGTVKADEMNGEHHTGLFGQTTFTKWKATRIPENDSDDKQSPATKQAPH